jgi:hypothetical protein
MFIDVFVKILTKINNSKMFIYIFVNILIKINNPNLSLRAEFGGGRGGAVSPSLMT